MRGIRVIALSLMLLVGPPFLAPQAAAEDNNPPAPEESNAACEVIIVDGVNGSPSSIGIWLRPECLPV